MVQFYKIFDVFWTDQKSGFKAGDTLVCRIMSSLKMCPITDNDSNENILAMDVVSRGLYFIFKGHVNLFYKNSSELARLGPGSYFGDISYFLNIKNQYIFQFQN